MIFRRIRAGDIVTWGSLSLVLFGALVPFAWLFHWRPVLRFVPGAPFVTLDAGLGFVLAGLALISAARKAVLPARTLGVVITVFGSVNLTTALWGRHFTLHYFFPELTGAVAYPTPGSIIRMAAAAALIFTLLGILVVLLSPLQPSRLSLNVASFIASAISSIGVLGGLVYLTGVGDEGAWTGLLVKMAMPTVMGICIAGACACALFWVKSSHAERRLSAAAATLTLMALLLLFGGIDSFILRNANVPLATRGALEATTRKIAQVQRMVESVGKAESKLHGLQLSGLDEYRKASAEAIVEGSENLRKLKSDPQADSRTDHLCELVDQKLTELSSFLSSERAAGNKVDRLAFNKSFALTDQIFKESAKVVTGLRSELAERFGQNDRSLRLMQKTVLVSFLIAALMICLSITLLRLEIRRREVVEAELRESGHGLERMVVERTSEISKQSEELRYEVSQRKLIENALREADDRLRVALDFAKVAVWTWTPADDQTVWSGPVEEVFGVAGAQLSGYAAFKPGVLQEDREALDAAVARALREKSDFHAEFRIVRPDGEIRWIAGRGGAKTDEDGKTTKMAGVNFDISEKKAAEIRLAESEKALRKREQQLAMLFATGAIGDFLWDFAKDEVTAHPVIWGFFGKPDGEGSGPASWFIERYHPDDAERMKGELQAAVEGRTMLDTEYRVVTPDGKVRWVTSRGLLIRDQDDKPTHMLGFGMDITERKTAELRVRESERELRELADAMPQIIWRTGPGGEMDYCNARWYEYTGQTVEETREMGWLTGAHPNDYQICREASEQGFFGDRPFEFEYRLRRSADGAYRWHLARFLPYHDENGRTVRWFGTGTDIHEQKIAKELLEMEVISRTSALELLQLKEGELVRSLGEKNTLLQELHHRVKNNLQIISSLLRMQSDLLNDEEASAALEECHNRVLSMALVHEQLYGQRQMDEIDFEEYTKTLVDQLLYSYAGDNRLTSTLDTSPVLLKIDQAIPCGLILNELVTNALKYAYPKQSTGEITIYLRQSAAGVVTLRVCDQGVGLPDGFDVRAAKSMGLPIVQILTDQLGGELSVGPAPGASFTIVFPAEAVDAPVMQVVSTRS